MAKQFAKTVNSTPSSSKITLGRQISDFLHITSHTLSSAVESASDTFLSLLSTSLDLSDKSVFCIGEVKYNQPMHGYYRVQIENETLGCCALSNSCDLGVAGTIDNSVFSAGTRVVVLRTHPKSSFGFIIGAIPLQTSDANHNFSGQVVMGSGVGGMTDEYYTYYRQTLKASGGIRNYTNHRNADALSTDWGVGTVTGAALHLDPTLVKLQLNEICGVFAIWPDLLRVTGNNLELQSAAHRQQFTFDEGESCMHLGETPYIWESLGCYSFDTDIAKTGEAKNVANGSETYYQPREDDQQPIWRYEEYGGYLGQGRIRQMSAPGSDHEELNTADAPHNIGLFREYVGLDGTYLLQSAKSLTLAKMSAIPVPKRVRPAEDYTEDCDSRANSNYKAAGVFSDSESEADEHKVGDIEHVVDDTTVESVLNVLDGLTYDSNWKSLHAFHYHEKDFDLQEVSDTEEEKVQFPLDFSELQTNHGFLAPSDEAGMDVVIDHRWQTTIYKLLSMLRFTDDGGMVLIGGHGEEIRFVRGQVQISAPDGVFVQPGKSFVVMAGDDAIVKARNSVDISASNNDVRIKAERNLMMLGGNSDEGGVLIESRSSGTTHNYPVNGGEEISGTGIVLKASQSHVATIAGEIYLRTGSFPTALSGDIILDAAKGDANIISVANSTRQFLKSKETVAFGLPKTQAVYTRTASGQIVPATTYIDGALAVGGGISSGRSITAVSGHFSSPQGGNVSRLADPRLLSAQLQLYEDLEKSEVRDHIGYYETHERNYYAKNKIGNQNTQAEVSFGMRTEKDYGTDKNFILLENYWQSLASAQGSDAVTNWSEPSVRYQNYSYTQPWPGHSAWTGKFFQKAGLSMYNLEEGRPKDRGDDYTEPKYKQTERSNANTDYVVIRLK